MAGEIKIMTEEQHDLIMNDLAKFISEMSKIREDFDGVKMRKEIIEELKKSLSQKNSLFKSLEREELELEQNLDALKNVKREFEECRNKLELRLIFAFGGGVFLGSFFTILMYRFMGMFG